MSKITYVMLKEKAKKNGIEMSVATVRRRKKSGWTDEKIVTTPVNNTRCQPQDMYNYKGQMYSMSQLAVLACKVQDCLVEDRSIYTRIKSNHWSVEDAVERSIATSANDRHKNYWFAGQQYSLGELWLISRYKFGTDISFSSLHDRIIKYDWPVDKAVITKYCSYRSNRARSGFDLPDEMIQRFAKRLLTERPIGMSLIGVQN